MSPFGILLRDIRLRHGLRQADLALLMGYEQTYWSALELGTKGPPPAAFVAQLVDKLDLDDKSSDELLQALDDSCRRMTLAPDAPAAVYRVFNEFRRQAETLHPAQLALIEQALCLRPELKSAGLLETPRIRRRQAPTAGEEGEMT